MNPARVRAGVARCPPGTSLTPSPLRDVARPGTADPGIVAVRPGFPGQYPFPARRTGLSTKGWNGPFDVA